MGWPWAEVYLWAELVMLCADHGVGWLWSAGHGLCWPWAELAIGWACHGLGWPWSRLVMTWTGHGLVCAGDGL
jgi:hypothetical protein